MSKFNKEMTISQVIAAHPRAGDVLSGFHLGGCAHCAVANYETIQQVCEGYEIPIDDLLKSLEELSKEEKNDAS